MTPAEAPEDASPASDLVVERAEHVLVVRINRPAARNALSRSVMFAMGAAFLGAENDPEVRVVVVTGTGDRAFCAGMDLAEFAGGVGGDPPSDDPRMLAFERFSRGELALPVIGAANGAAVGGGFEILLGCDIVVAAESARFGLPEVKRGLFAAGGGTFIASRIPVAIALELALTGDLIDAARAHQLGLVNTVVPATDLMGAALDFATRIAANGPLALRATKELVRLGAHDTARAWERYAHWLPVVFGSDDAREGAAAFVEKRTPIWRGR